MSSSNKFLDVTFEKVTASIEAGIFDFFCTGIALLDEECRVSYCNKAFMAIFGLPEDIRGQSISQYFLVSDSESIESWSVKKVSICSGKTASSTSCISIRYPLYDAHGKLRGVLFESHPASMNKAKMLSIIDYEHSLESGSYDLNQQKKNSKKSSGLCTFDDIIGTSPCIEQIPLWQGSCHGDSKVID